MDCGKPPFGTNTIPIPANLSLKLGDQYTYSCIPGFKLASGDVTTICQDNGTLSIEPPICTGITTANKLPYYHLLTTLFKVFIEEKSTDISSNKCSVPLDFILLHKEQTSQSTSK